MPEVLAKCENSECPLDAYYSLKNGSEIELLCDECFKDALIDLLVMNGRLNIVEVKDQHYELL